MQHRRTALKGKPYDLKCQSPSSLEVRGNASVESKRLNVKVLKVKMLKVRCSGCACDDGHVMPRKWSVEVGVMTIEE